MEDEASVSEDDSQSADDDDPDGPDEYEADFIDVATQPGGARAKGCVRMLSFTAYPCNPPAPASRLECLDNNDSS